MSYKQDRDLSKLPTQLSFLLTPKNQIQWSEAIESKAGMFGPDGDAIATRIRPDPRVRPEGTLSISYRTEGSRPGRVKTVRRIWNEQDEMNLRLRQATFDAQQIQRGKDASALWNFIKESCSEEIWNEMELCPDLKTWRNQHDTFSLMELAELSANNLAKLGVTDLNTAWLADVQGNRSIVTFARDFKRKIEQLIKCGEVISESRKSAVFKKNVDQKHYDVVLTSLYTVPEGADGYPLLKDVITRLIDHDRTHPRSVQQSATRGSKEEGGAVAAFNTYTNSGSTKEPNTVRQCCKTSLSASTVEAHKSNPPCDNCSKVGHKRKDCPYEDAECDYCHKSRHLRQFCHQEVHDNTKKSSSIKKPDRGAPGGGKRQQRDRDQHGGDRRGRDKSPPSRRRDRSRSRSPPRRRDRSRSRDRNNTRDSDRREDRQRGGRDDHRDGGGNKKKHGAYHVSEGGNREQHTPAVAMDESDAILCQTHNQHSDVDHRTITEWLCEYDQVSDCTETGTSRIPNPWRIEEKMRSLPLAYLCMVYRAGHNPRLFENGQFQYNTDDVYKYFISLPIGFGSHDRVIKQWDDRDDERSAFSRFDRRDRSRSRDSSVESSVTEVSKVQRGYMLSVHRLASQQHRDTVLFDTCTGVHIEQRLDSFAAQAIVNTDTDIIVYGIDGRTPLQCSHTGFHALVGHFRVVPGAGANLCSVSQLTKRGHTISILDSHSMRISSPNGASIIATVNSDGHYEASRVEYNKLLVSSPSVSKAFPVSHTGTTGQNAVSRAARKVNSGAAMAQEPSGLPLFTKDQRTRADQEQPSPPPMSPITEPYTVRA